MALALKRFESALGLPCRPLRFEGQAMPGAAADLEKALSSPANENLLQAIGLSLSAPAYTPNAVMTCKDRKSRERQMRITSLSMVITTAALMLLLTFCGKLYMGYWTERRTRPSWKTGLPRGPCSTRRISSGAAWLIPGNGRCRPGCWRNAVSPPRS